LLFELYAEIEKLKKENAQLRSENEQLRLENTELRSRLNQNSSNSSKPPSSDGLAKKPAFPKTVKGKKGGKPGHKGKTLQMVATPDLIIEHQVQECSCGASLTGVAQELCEKHQVFDLPEPRLEVSEHRIYRCICPACGKEHRGDSPDVPLAPASYGKGVKALVVLLSNSYKLPFKKVQSLFEDLFGYPINESTVYSANESCYEHLATTEERIKNKLTESTCAHADETGLRVEGKLHWLHSLSDGLHTYLFVHPKRGREAIESQYSLIPHLNGWLVHDCWSSYFGITTVKHAICGAHLLRELQGLTDNGCRWAKTFQAFLLNIYLTPFDTRSAQRANIEKRYDLICHLADKIEPPPNEKQGKGRKKATKGRNLLIRLIKHKDAVLAFAFNQQVPFTNNQAERDIRPAKLKQKISGCFRTFNGAHIYARIEGFISSARKNQLNVFKELKNTFNGYNHFTLSEVPC
jgi:transposase